MGYDLVTWSPRIGSGGDDAYDIPGSTKLDGTLDAAARLNCGAGSSAFSATPTIGEVNSSSHFNQVVGLLNRRIVKCNSQFGSAFSTLAYFPRRKIVSGDLIAIQTAINQVRVYEGFAAYTFITAGELTSRATIKGRHLAELRKALRIAGTLVRPVGDYNGGYRRWDNPYGTQLGEDELNIVFNDNTIGKLYDIGPPNRLYRYRCLFSYTIPEFASALSSAKLTLKFLNVFNTPAPTVQVWSSNSDDSAGYGVTAPYGAYNLDNFESNLAGPTAGVFYDFSLSTVRVLAKASLHLSLIVTTEEESTGGGSATGGGLADISFGLNRFYLTLDFGA